MTKKERVWLMQKKIFILGAGMLQVPAIKAAKKRGFYVYAIDYDPRAVGLQYVDEHLNISTVDKESVLAAAKRFKPDFIITSTSDMPVRTVSWVNEMLGKPSDISYEGAVCATDKVKMRRRMKEAGVPIPEFHEIKSKEDFLRVAAEMPEQFILKPADNAASRGVVLVDKKIEPDLEKLYRYCVQYSRSGETLVEEFMTGPEVSVESYTIDGVPHIISITDKLITEKPFFVELGHTEPSRLPDEMQEEIKRVAIAAILAIGMKNGPNHTEVKLTPTGAKLVEIAARLGGDFIASRLVPLSTGVDMIECSFAGLLGEPVNYRRTLSRGAAIRFIPGEKGILESINGVERASSMPGVQEVNLYKLTGDSIKRPENSLDRVGHVIAVGANAEEAAQNAENALREIKLVLK